MDDILLKANWHCMDNPVSDVNIIQFGDHMAETGEQYTDWLDRLNIHHHDIWPQKIESNKLIPKIYFKFEEHMELFKSMLVELKMSYG